MNSKLFHTIVGVGIALGAISMTGCAEPADETSTSGSELQTGDKPATEQGPSRDAFDDNCWPTTKGSPPCLPPPIDPDAACRPLGEPFRCVVASSPTSCQVSSIQSARCIDEEWKCASGQIPLNSCECWVGEPGCDAPTK
jgi:hypothetical protein